MFGDRDMPDSVIRVLLDRLYSCSITEYGSLTIIPPQTKNGARLAAIVTQD